MNRIVAAVVCVCACSPAATNGPVASTPPTAESVTPVASSSGSPTASTASTASVSPTATASSSATTVLAQHSALCANATNICLSGCDELVSRLQASVAKPIVDCLKTANSETTCVPPAAYACVQKHLSSTKTDPQAEADCDRLAKVCAGTKSAKSWRVRCSKQFPALSAHGRDAVIDCMSANQCGGFPYFNDDVGSCVYDDHPA